MLGMEVGTYLAKQKNDVTIIGRDDVPLWVFHQRYEKARFLIF